ncbi:hypothetical protein Tco_1551323, partial [Tanacetum coccineum]
MDHICEEVISLHSKLGDMESSIVQQVSAEIKSSLPALVTNTLKEQLPSFLLDSLKDTLPQFLKDSIKSSVLKSITGKEKSSEEDTLGKKETDDEPPAKKLKFLIPSSSIPSPTPLKSIMPEPPKYTEAVKMTLAQFTEHLSKTTSSIFSPTPPREPTSPRDESKGKGISTEETLKDIMPFIEEGGSVPKMPKTKSFTTSVGPLSQEEFNAQIKEMKRLADLKAEKEK